jgi:hypothetical protein
MSNQAYVGLTKRTFEHALVHLLETDYALLGCRRVLQMMAKDVQQMTEQFYPPAEHLSSGSMLLTGTKANGHKAYPGDQAADYELVTLAWPVLTPEDRQYLATQPETKQARQQWFQRRLIRLIEHGWQHPDGPVLLTVADLAAMVGLTTVQVSQLLKAARQITGKALLTKGYYFDQGMRPSHKAQIIALYEQGLDEVEIARRTQHAQTSVGRYIRDYERVKLLLKQNIPVEQISQLIEMQPGVVDAYVKLVSQYHPALTPVTKS